ERRVESERRSQQTVPASADDSGSQLSHHNSRSITRSAATVVDSRDSSQRASSRCRSRSCLQVAPEASEIEPSLKAEPSPGPEIVVDPSVEAHRIRGAGPVTSMEQSVSKAHLNRRCRLAPGLTECTAEEVERGRQEVGRLKFRGRVPPWRWSVCYLGITLDHRLSWKPAVASHQLSSRRVAGAASSLLARDKDCSPDITLGMYNTCRRSQGPVCVLFGHFASVSMGDSRDEASWRHSPPPWNAWNITTGHDLRRSYPVSSLAQSQGLCSVP
ncbi:hypothetical protein MRX96_006087, partial [Rhipicephalus microplus]